ncbi:hypothetical protein DNTS_002249 [Danionella cerebrum]|uniref:Uncharacterized protein n=1 Tax=Danionella cerebrum TaxID=2873325 RepID=A0A553P116_9TELE|nr:hypothetical protein DNTS_002249 [Danionella translucida]
MLFVPRVYGFTPSRAFVEKGKSENSVQEERATLLSGRLFPPLLQCGKTAGFSETMDPSNETKFAQEAKPLI